MIEGWSSLLATSGWITKDADQRGQVEGILKAPSAAAIRQLTTDHNLDYSLDNELARVLPTVTEVYS